MLELHPQLLSQPLDVYIILKESLPPRSLNHMTLVLYKFFLVNLSHSFNL